MDIVAATVMKKLNLKSIFDVYYAATALHAVPGHTIISTGDTLNKVIGIKRVDREACRRHSPNGD